MAAGCKWNVVGELAAILAVVAITSGTAAAQGLQFDGGRSPGLSSLNAGDGESAIPANFVIPHVVRPLVARVWRQSRTFRRQCARLAEHPNVSVRLELARKVRDTTGARSLIAQSNGHLSAIVEIELRKPERYIEHIAHELEHVLEQLDGIDLRRLARQGVDGIVSVGTGYETLRARTVGRLVAKEAITS